MRDLPTIQGAVLLVDAVDGRLLAILDSIEVTLRRTAAATALAARHLAKPQSTRVAILGCGAQAGPQLDALRAVLPITEVRVWDAVRARAERFAHEVAAGGMIAAAADDLERRARRRRGGDLHHRARALPRSGPCRAWPVHRGRGRRRPGKERNRPGADGPRLLSSMCWTSVWSWAICTTQLARARWRLRTSTPSLPRSSPAPGRGDGRARPVRLRSPPGTGVQDVAAAAMIYDRALQDRRVMRRPGAVDRPFDRISPRRV